MLHPVNLYSVVVFTEDSAVVHRLLVVVGEESCELRFLTHALATD